MFTSQTETNSRGHCDWGTGNVAYPARRINSIFIFLPRSISPSIFPAADHTCIFITDLWLSRLRKPRALKAGVTAPWRPSRARNGGSMRGFCVSQKMRGNECGCECELSGAGRLYLCLLHCWSASSLYGKWLVLWVDGGGRWQHGRGHDSVGCWGRWGGIFQWILRGRRATERVAVGVKAAFVSSLFQSVQIGILEDRTAALWGLQCIIYKQL